MQKITIPPLERRPLTEDELREVVTRTAELLDLRYRGRSLGNQADLLDETIYILLSKQTREVMYQRAYRALRARWPHWSSLLNVDAETIELVIGGVGFGKQKAGQLKQLVRAVADACDERGRDGEVTLDWLTTMSDQQVESFLVSLPGVGPKTARCVMHYALGRESFAVDSNIRRVFDRLGLVKDSGGKVDHTLY